MQEVSRGFSPIMGSKVFMTYKRKRLFSRNDHSESLMSKSSANFDEHEKPLSEHVLLDKERDIEIQHEYPQRNDKENLLHCENCNSEDHSGETHRRDFVVEEKSSNAQSKPLFVNFGSEYKCEEEKDPIPRACDECSVMELGTLCSYASVGNNCSRQMDTCVSGAFTSEEVNKLNKDRDGLVMKCKFGKALITYQRRSKRKRDSTAPNVASQSETQLAGTTLIAWEEKKKPPEEINNSHTSPVPALEISTAVQTDDQLAKSTPSAVTGFPQDIDCNLPPVSSFDENHLPWPSEVLPDSLVSVSTINENMQMKPARAAVVDKGKAVVDSLSVSTGISSKNKYLQLFPENSDNEALRLANDQEKLRLEDQASYYSRYPWPSTQPHPSETFHSFLVPTPNQVQSLSRQKQSLLRQNMILDNILIRARTGRGNHTVFPDTFRPPTSPWSEEELDCLWIGVRRHGRGNWDAILRDRRLQFSPWKTPSVLADRWHEEQSRLFHTAPVSQGRCPNPNPFPSIDEVQLSLGNGYARRDQGGVPNGYFFHPLNIDDTNVRFQELGGVSGTPLSSYGYFTSLGTGNLPHWLKQAVEAPVGCPGMQWVNEPNAYPGFTGRNESWNSPVVVSRGRSEGRKRKVGKPDGLIVIPSDGSSEETISDRSIRG